jgi:hypothetical protein
VKPAWVLMSGAGGVSGDGLEDAAGLLPVALDGGGEARVGEIDGPSWTATYHAP